MKLKTFTLSEGENHLEFESGRDGWMREVISHVKGRGVDIEGIVAADLILTKLSPEYFLRGTLEFSANLTCDRCAEPFTRAISHAVGVALAELPKGVDIRTDEGDVSYFENEEIDMMPVIEEQLVLSLPYRALCKQDCAGISTQAEPKPESGSPFSVLKKLKK